MSPYFQLIMHQSLLPSAVRSRAIVDLGVHVSHCGGGPSTPVQSSDRERTVQIPRPPHQPSRGLALLRRLSVLLPSTRGHRRCRSLTLLQPSSTCRRRHSLSVSSSFHVPPPLCPSPSIVAASPLPPLCASEAVTFASEEPGAAGSDDPDLSGRSSSLEERDISRHHPLPLFHVRSAIASFSVDLSAPLGCRFASVTIRIDDLDQKRGTQATTTALFSSPSSVLHCSSPPSSSRSPRRLGTIGSATRRTHERWGVGANRWLRGREGEARAGVARLSHQSHDDGKAASTMARDELT